MVQIITSYRVQILTVCIIQLISFFYLLLHSQYVIQHKDLEMQFFLFSYRKLFCFDYSGVCIIALQNAAVVFPKEKYHRVFNQKVTLSLQPIARRIKIHLLVLNTVQPLVNGVLEMKKLHL